MSDQPVEVRLTIPAVPEFLRLARLAAADVASRVDFTYEEIEDLRIGVDELCHSIMGDGSGRVELVFRLEAASIEVVGQGPPSRSRSTELPNELSRTIVAAVVDEHELSRDGDAPRFRLLKRARRR